jgi:GntR family transcriptional regulator / MocR family aminotransferase
MDLVITFDSKSVLPLHRQLYEELRRSILTGRLLPGQRVPSTRAMARSLGISRTTVTQSYEDLLSEGYLQASHGSGTFICEQLPEELLRSSTERNETKEARLKRESLQLSAYGASIVGTLPAESTPKDTLISFKPGTLDYEAIPLKQWGSLMSRHFRSCNRAMLDYTNNPLGYVPLREAIAGYLARSRAVRCDPDQVIIVNGSQQALDLISRVLIDRGDTVAMEDPGYLGARHTFQAHGARLWPVAVDDSGIVIERLPARSAAKLKVIYLTPSHQFPTGMVLSLPRRLELLQWAQKRNAFIIEDDYDSEYRYGGRPIPALQGLDKSDSVVYVGTFSKVLFPALRIAYMVAPKSLVAVLACAKRLADRQSPLLEQYVLTDFINDGHLERHIRRMRTLYGRRRQTLARSLAMHLGDRVTITGESAGMHLMAQIKSRRSDEEIIERAGRLGVELVSARQYYLRSECSGKFVLGFAGLTERKIQEGVRRLSKALEE